MRSSIEFHLDLNVVVRNRLFADRTWQPGTQTTPRVSLPSIGHPTLDDSDTSALHQPRHGRFPHSGLVRATASTRDLDGSTGAAL